HRLAEHRLRPNNSLLLIADAHHIVSQQFLIVVDLVDERDRNVAGEQDALGPPIVIQNRSTRQSPGVHDRPYLLQCLVDVTGKRGLVIIAPALKLKASTPADASI